MARFRERADDRGVTLIELLVSMLIFSVVITAAYAALFMVQTQTKDTLARADAVQQAKLAIAQMDRQIRSGNVLYDPAQEASLGFPMSMRIYTQANGQEKCVQWQIVSGNLRMRSWSPNWQTDNVVTAWTTIARGIVNQSSVSTDTPKPESDCRCWCRSRRPCCDRPATWSRRTGGPWSRSSSRAAGC